MILIPVTRAATVKLGSTNVTPALAVMALLASITSSTTLAIVPTGTLESTARNMSTGARPNLVSTALLANRLVVNKKKKDYDFTSPGRTHEI